MGNYSERQIQNPRLKMFGPRPPACQFLLESAPSARRSFARALQHRSRADLLMRTEGHRKSLASPSSHSGLFEKDGKSDFDGNGGDAFRQ
jgi:hypothetical protein